MIRISSVMERQYQRKVYAATHSCIKHILPVRLAQNRAASSGCCKCYVHVIKKFVFSLDDLNDVFYSQLFTLRTIHKALAVSLARMHHAVRLLHISPQFGQQLEDSGDSTLLNDGTLVEEVDGSTAWNFSLVADVCTLVSCPPLLTAISIRLSLVIDLLPFFRFACLFLEVHTWKFRLSESSANAWS